MAAPSSSARVARLHQGEAQALSEKLAGDPAYGGPLENQHVLDALDRGEYSRFLVWPESDPVGLVYLGAYGTVIPSGAADAGPALSPAVERSNWRVLIGPAALGNALLAAGSRGLFRRKTSAREQRFMVCRNAPGLVEEGLRPAVSADVDTLTEFAARLHVEDRMGPPLGRTGVSAVRARMVESIARRGSWVVEREGRPVAKIDVSLHSRLRGAQIAGVYVDRDWRGHGLASRAVGMLAGDLLAEGLPGVTLHVRADNTAAIRAYHRAGFSDEARWVLALR